MKKLKFNEFNERISEVAKARKIFIPNITKNISIAFELYQELLVDEAEKLPPTIATSKGGNRSLTPFDDYIRPRCDECNAELRLKQQAIDPAGKTHNTAWICGCGMEYYSDKTVPEWLEEVKNETRK